MNKFKYLWQNELKTKEQIKAKKDEIKSEYKNYIKLVKLYNWNNNVVNDNIKGFKKTLSEADEWLKEF